MSACREHRNLERKMQHSRALSKQRGFSLIELLIVVAIILIIAAIAIPNLLRARMAANESSAVGSFARSSPASLTSSRTTALVTRLWRILEVRFLARAFHGAPACLIDNSLALGTKSGYTIATPGAALRYGSGPDQRV